MKEKELPALKLLNYLLRYDNTTDTIHWKVSRKNGQVRIGSIAGNINKNNKRFYIGINNCHYKLERIIYKLVHGACPIDYTVKHLDGNKFNNKIGNLLLVQVLTIPQGMRKCKTCRLIIPLKKFNGGKVHCRHCQAISRKSKVNKIKTIYDNQVVHSKTRGDSPPNYTKQELIEWCLRQPIYRRLHAVWKLSGHNTLLAPSCDRIDDYKPYTLGNIQLMTWGENASKYKQDAKNGVNTKQCDAVLQLHKHTGKVIQRFHSQGEAARKTGAQQSCICGCCIGDRITAGGYKWRYADVS